MSFNGSGTFQINTAGQPVVTGTVISSTAFNALTADLATGLSTCITKDGQTTPTANIPMAGFKLTGLGNGTASTDAATLGQVQSNATRTLTVSGTDTLTASGSPALTSYTAGLSFVFVVANTNSTAVTLNIDGLGAKNVTRDGSTALVAGDLVAGEVVQVVYDGTRFQVLNRNSMTNLNLSGTLTVASTATAASFVDTAGKVRAVPQAGSAKTTSYTLATTDLGQFVQVGTGGSIVIPNSTFAAGDIVSVFNNTTGNVTITCSTTNAYIAGIDSNKTSVTLVARGVATVLFITSTLCVITGSVY